MHSSIMGKNNQVPHQVTISNQIYFLQRMFSLGDNDTRNTTKVDDTILRQAYSEWKTSHSDWQPWWFEATETSCSVLKNNKVNHEQVLGIYAQGKWMLGLKKDGNIFSHTDLW